MRLLLALTLATLATLGQAVRMRWVVLLLLLQ